MSSRLERFQKVARLADDRTPVRRLLAAVIAGVIAFGLTQLLLGIIWGAGSAALLFSSFALAIAAAFAAATMRRGMAVVYGVLGAIWLLVEGLLLAVTICFSAFG